MRLVPYAPPPPRPPLLSARWLLFGDMDEDAVADGAVQPPPLPPADELSRLSHFARTAVTRELGKSTAALAEVDIVDVLAGGWRKHRALRDAARRTLAQPGTQEVVELAAHRITSVHKPSVDLLVNGAQVSTIHFELKIELVFKGLVAYVGNGRLTSLASGDCDTTVTLTCEGFPVAKRTLELNLDLFERNLGSGIALAE